MKCEAAGGDECDFEEEERRVGARAQGGGQMPREPEDDKEEGYHRKGVDWLCHVEGGQVIELAPIKLRIGLTPIPRFASVREAGGHVGGNAHEVNGGRQRESEQENGKNKSRMHGACSLRMRPVRKWCGGGAEEDGEGACMRATMMEVCHEV